MFCGFIPLIKLRSCVYTGDTGAHYGYSNLFSPKMVLSPCWSGHFSVGLGGRSVLFPMKICGSPNPLLWLQSEPKVCVLLEVLRKTKLSVTLVARIVPDSLSGSFPLNLVLQSVLTLPLKCHYPLIYLHCPLDAFFFL